MTRTPNHSTPPEQSLLHPRNRHPGRHDFARMLEQHPQLTAFMTINAYHKPSIDFSRADAVKAFNQALLSDYGITNWDIPPGHLCPPIPGRADYLHHLADLLAETNHGVIPRGQQVRGLDIGVGASGIYPLLGHSEFGWQFLGSDIAKTSLDNVQRILQNNPGFAEAIELRLQANPAHIFHGLLQAGECFELTLCNPPFHGSAEDARRSHQSRTRAQNTLKTKPAPALNFGGQDNELWCNGGEADFLQRMVEESAALKARVLWFSSLVSRASSLPGIYASLETVGANEVRTINMAQGRKQSRLVAWTFLSSVQRTAWPGCS